jgi:hypothetical protein
MQEIIGQVRSGTETITTASSEIAAGNLDLLPALSSKPRASRKPPLQWNN